MPRKSKSKPKSKSKSLAKEIMKSQNPHSVSMGDLKKKQREDFEPQFEQKEK